MLKLRIPVKPHLYKFLVKRYGDPITINYQTHPLFADVAMLLEPFNPETIPVIAGHYITLEVGRFRCLDTRVINHLSAENAEVLAAKLDQVYFNSDFFQFMDYGKYRMHLEVNELIYYYLHDRGIEVEEDITHEALRKRYQRYENGKHSIQRLETIYQRIPVKKLQRPAKFLIN